MASALSIQSPFLSFLQCDPETITRRRPMMSSHGDPLTLLNLFDEWIQVKSDGQNTRTWCKRRGVEEQRLYDITKLRRQFQEILRVNHVLLLNLKVIIDLLGLQSGDRLSPIENTNYIRKTRTLAKETTIERSSIRT